MGAVALTVGCGGAPILRRKLSAEHLVRAVSRIIVDPRLTDNVIHLGEKVGQEDGVSRAVDLIIQRFLPKQDVT